MNTISQPGVYTYIDPHSGGTRYAFIAKPPVRAASARAVCTAPTRHVRIPLTDIVDNAYPQLSPSRAARKWLRATKFLRGCYDESPAVRRSMTAIRQLARGQ